MSIFIDDDNLKDFYNLSDDELKNKTVAELQKLHNDMLTQKAFDEAKRNEKDEEYARLVQKYFTPYHMLNKYWTDKEIILACSKHIGARNIVSEYKTENQHCPYPDAEFIKTSNAYIDQYYHGHKLAQQKWAKVNIFRIKNEYQGIYHGDIILELLYSRHPVLSKYEFDAYSYDYNCPYEIYPKNHIYVPFEALMQKDINAIIQRNIDYAASYNTGSFSPAEMQKRLNSDEIKEFFETIKNM